jgi:hypothetical protein
MNQKYIQIINDKCLEVYGKPFIVAESNSDDTRLNIRSNIDKGYRLFTFFTEDGHFIINLPYFYNPKDRNHNKLPIEIKCDDLNIFKQTLKPIFDLLITPHIIQAYKQNQLDELPPTLQTNIPNVDLSKLTVESFEQLFNETTEEESNGETTLNIQRSVSYTDVKFEFLVDCGRQGIHKHNIVTVNYRGKIHISLAEIIEGGGIEETLEEKILKLITE